MSVSIPSDAPKPRQCHVKKWEDFNGYGFNLHAEKGKHGHHIGALDPGSPAEAAGIKEGDRIVEVNGTNIANENHQQVVSRIRAVANEVKLLVVDTATDDYYREKKVVVRGDMAGVVRITTPASKAAYEADPMAGYAAAAAATTDESEPQPRLAKLHTWADFQGYGFNLTTEKNKPGQYIGKVDTESPASTAGVREGDRIIEVNGVNVTEETHHQVVNRIKARPGQVDLLLADKATDLHYAGLGVVIRGDMPQIQTGETPESSKGTSQLQDVPPPTPPPAVPDVTPEEAAVAVAAVVAAAETLPEVEQAVVEAAVVAEVVAEPEVQAAVEEVTEEEAAAAVAAVAVVAAEAEAAEVEAEVAVVEAAAAVPEVQAVPEPEPQQDLVSPMEAAEAVAVVAAAAEVAAVESDAPRPRLCHVRKWPTFQGYGFTLNAGGPKGHFIGNADAGSPAAAAGLRKDDKIIEVNGSSIFEDDHKSVIGKITSDPTEVKLLVVDEVTEAYYKELKIKVHSSMSEVEVIVCPREEPSAAEVVAAVEAEVAEAEVAVAAVAVAAAVVEAEAEVGPSPRLCHLKRWSDFQGYGFNLNAEKGRVGNFIGAVDKGSPAEAAGVQTGDNIVEVNGDDVEAASHGQVVGKITADKTQVKMLLVDAATHAYYTEKGVKITSSLPSVKVIVCPDENPGATVAPAAVAAVGVPRPRLHHLKKWPNFPGYGFNLHERLKQPGHLIGSVDPDSPAEATGMRVDDKIIEVNGKNMLDCSHHQVVDRIKQYSDRVSLLVVDDMTDRYYQDRSVWVHSKMPNVDEITCPSSNDKAPRPRLFHLLKWPDFQGYGFDLHEEKTRPGHLIGSVDPGSPSAYVGMRRDDKIIEVNGHNVLEESHKRVVERITENDATVKLLVVDSVAEQYYNDNSIWVHGRMDNIDIVECPAQTPAPSAGGPCAKEPVEVVAEMLDGLGPRTTEPVVVETSNDINVHAASDTIDHASAVLGIADIKPKPPQHTPRLCNLQISPEFPGYGFDLLNEKDREGHFVGAIEENSPAGRSALREGDHVVEVNGVNVETTDHSDVVELIKSGHGSLKLLVVDDQAWHYFVNNNIKVSEDLAQGSEEVVHVGVNGATASAVENGYDTTSSSHSSTVGVSRLCHLQSNPAAPGYGFELHRLQRTKGHFIGPIDPGSPAEMAGLHKGDEIVEINGTNVQRKSHNEVVLKLKENLDRVTLLLTSKNPLAAASTSTTGLTNGAQMRHHTPHARHCHLKKWSDFDGYGFDLYEIRKNPGPRIGNVAKGSPAEATGFRQDDYIIEVNGENVEELRHPDMVTKIGGSTQVKMLLVDEDAHSHFKRKSVGIHSGMDNVENIYCPDNRNVVAVTTGPRRLQLKTVPGFSGFGFDLQELTNKSGHYIGGVDPGSPAAAAGLERDDQIVEVNDQSVVKDSHDEVVNKIRQSPGEVSLMVISAGSSTVYHSNALWVNTGNRDTVIMVPTGADAVDSSNTVISETAPRPRLCKLQRWADYSGYGFDLHEEKNQSGHIIGSVDPGSPADTAGLRVKDQIVEVNAHNVLESPHHEVVNHIKQHEDRVDLLVLDPNAKDYYDDNSIWVHSKLSNVHVIECPRRSSSAAEIPIPIPVPGLSTVAANGAEPALRLCVLKKWSDYQGYGFNLHDEKGVAGHFIGSVDAGSPAEMAGLKANDKLIEVNGEPVFDDDHHEVVGRVTSKPDGVELLVMDQTGDEYFRAQNVKPHGGMSNITVLHCPPHSSGQVEGAVVEESHVVEEHHSPVHHAATVVAVTGSEHTHAATPGALRHCTLKKWHDYSGYGFNLHDERGKPGHFIGGVETGSPAESAGLKVEYQLYEVNGISVKSADHSMVIEYVLSNPDQVSLLIGHPSESEQYIEQGSWPHSRLPNVTNYVGSESSPATTLAAHTMAEPEPVIRLCHLRKWTTYEGYGFRLHDDKNKPGHFIGPLEPGSPAELAGLQKGDRVMEVNGVSCEDMSHHQVVSKIVANPGEVRLLVLDAAADRHYAHRGVWPHGAMPNVSRSECPVVQPSVAHTNGVAEVKVDEIEVAEHNGHAYVEPDREPAREPSPVAVRVPTPEPVRAATPEPVRVPTPEPVRAPTPEPINEAPRVPTPEPVHHREPSPPPQQVNEVVKTVVVTTVMSEMRNGTEIKPHVERTTEIDVESHDSAQMKAESSTVVVPAHVDITPVGAVSSEHHRTFEVTETHHNHFPAALAATSQAHNIEVASTSQAHATERASTSQPHSIEMTSASHPHTIEVASASHPHTIEVASASHPHTIEVASTSQAHNIDVANSQPHRMEVASSSQPHIVDRVTHSETSEVIMAVPPPPPREVEYRSAHVEEGHLTAYPMVTETVVVAEPRRDVHHTRPASATYSRVEVLEVSPEVSAAPRHHPEHVSVMAGGVRQSAPPGSLVVAGREETVRSAEIPGMVSTTSTSTTTITEHRVLENVVTDDGFVISTPLYTEVKREPSTTVNSNWEDARERMVEAHSEPVGLKSTTTAEGTFVTIGPSSTSEIRRSETEESLTSGSADLRGSEVVLSGDVEETEEQGIVLLDYRTEHVESVTPNLTVSQQIPHHEEHGTVTMTEEIDTSGIHIVPPPPPLPAEMSDSHTYTRETEVTYVESSVPQEDLGEAVSEHTTHITTAGAVSVAAIAADRLSISSAATSEASSTAAAAYNFQESEITTETSEIAQESHHMVGSSMNGVSEVVMVTSGRVEPEEPLYQNVERDVGYTSVVAVAAAEPVHVAAEPVEVVESHHHHDDHHHETSTVTTTTTEVVTLTSRTVRESGDFHHETTAEEVILAAPPPTEFTDVHNGSSRRSSASTMSDSANQYAFTTEVEDTNEAVSEFMSSTAEPSIIRTTSTTSSTYSYQKPAYEPEPYRNSQPAPADSLGGASLQEALSRVKSRKKPKAGTGNLSMKEKFELFQQL